MLWQKVIGVLDSQMQRGWYPIVVVWVDWQGRRTETGTGL